MKAPTPTMCIYDDRTFQHLKLPHTAYAVQREPDSEWELFFHCRLFVLPADTTYEAMDEFVNELIAYYYAAAL